MSTTKKNDVHTRVDGVPSDPTLGSTASSNERQSPSHWDQESVYSAEVDIGYETIYVAARSEVPMRDGQRLPRYGHRWYPTLVDIEGPGDVILSASIARELGWKLIAAADAAEAIDRPDTDTCGHWAPCDCSSELPPTADAVDPVGESEQSAVHARQKDTR